MIYDKWINDLKFQMKYKEIDREEAAKELGVGKSTVDRILTGKAGSVENIKKLSEFVEFYEKNTKK